MFTVAQMPVNFCNGFLGTFSDFRIYLRQNWTDMDKTWQTHGERGKSDCVNFSAKSLHELQQKKTTKYQLLPVCYDEYHAAVWSVRFTDIGDKINHHSSQSSVLPSNKMSSNDKTMTNFVRIYD